MRDVIRSVIVVTFSVSAVSAQEPVEPDRGDWMSLELERIVKEQEATAKGGARRVPGRTDGGPTWVSPSMRVLVANQIERGRRLGGERGASLLLGTQLETVRGAILEDEKFEEYLGEVFFYLAEKGTDDALPLLEKWLNAQVTHFRLWHYWIQPQASYPWYRIKSRGMNDKEKARLLLKILTPGFPTKVPPHRIPREEYVKYLPLVRSELYELLTDKEIPGYDSDDTRELPRPSFLARIIAQVDELHPSVGEAGMLLSNDGSLGQFVYLTYALAHDPNADFHAIVEKIVAMLREGGPFFRQGFLLDKFEYASKKDLIERPRAVHLLVQYGRETMKFRGKGDQLLVLGVLGALDRLLTRDHINDEVAAFFGYYLSWVETIDDSNADKSSTIQGCDYAKGILRRWGQQ